MSCVGGSDRLRSSLLLGRHTLEVDLADVNLYNELLAQKIQERPGEVVPLVGPYYFIMPSTHR
jgi:hypothetical protein